MSKKADLHCHSTFSDGTLSPEELIDLAIQSDLDGLSITDHDSIAAYPRALAYAKQKEFPLITGVEFSAYHRDETIHVLGYGFYSASPLIKHLCEKHIERRQFRNQEILELLTKHQMKVTENDIQKLAPLGTVTRPHIAQAMVEKGYVKSIAEAFHKYLGDGQPCYVEGVRFSVEETIEVIHQANGYAILAHPHLIQKKRVVNDLLEMDFDGLEGRYAKFTPNENRKWINIAQEKSWVITGGSDYHGTIKPNSSLGSSWTDEETFDLLLSQDYANNAPRSS